MDIPKFLTKRGKVVQPASMAEARRLESMGLEKVVEDTSMSWKELIEKVKGVFPDAMIGLEDDDEIVIHPGLVVRDDMIFPIKGGY
jgi:hypothetical protein